MNRDLDTLYYRNRTTLKTMASVYPYATTSTYGCNEDEVAKTALPTTTDYVVQKPQVPTSTPTNVVQNSATVPGI